MQATQRKNFYAQRFHSRLGPLTSSAAHVRQPKAAPFPSAPQGYAVAPSFQPIFRDKTRSAGRWQEDELSASTFRARALERMLDEPRPSFAPEKYSAPQYNASDTYGTAALRVKPAPKVAPRIAAQTQAARSVAPPQVSTGPVGPMRSAAQPVINAPLTSLDVLIGNSQITVQPKQNLLRKAAYLTQENGLPDIYADGSVSFASATSVCATELLLELTGPLANFAEYCGPASESKFIAFYAGANSIFSHVTCWADYLMHGTLESYEFGEQQLHLFRMPLGHEPSQGLQLRDKAKLRVSLQNLDLSQLRAAGLRHRFIVRYYEEK